MDKEDGQANTEDKDANHPFFQQFGFPKFKITRKNNNIIDISFERGAVCGSTEIIVKELIRHKIPLNNLGEKAGLFAQVGCLAGGEGSQDGAIYKGALPFVVGTIVAVGIVFLAPVCATWLPGLLK